MAGTRDYRKPSKVRGYIRLALEELLTSPLQPIEIASGLSGAVDLVAKRYARDHGIAYTGFAADWETYGKAAGPKRNKAQAKWGNTLLAIWDGKSRGTKNMIDEARKAGYPENRIIVVNYGEDKN